ncbi:hypothetical protein [Parerythrobacter lacustris]|uniref:RNA methyltransferase n=1 Tax=Parerythrobacter lacustris TaxID=2969984 RepID=A0ABT1XR22_9SPHN|nr:hypothetical protein [Parerythrobacter lacustris]MCR2834086.1 hypothetical protein [Parerythrobacter lacustris]
MATYREIQDWVKKQSGFVPKTCWIADLKHQHKLTAKIAPNRQGSARAYPCPPDRREAIESAFRHYGMIK